MSAHLPDSDLGGGSGWLLGQPTTIPCSGNKLYREIIRKKKIVQHRSPFIYVEEHFRSQKYLLLSHISVCAIGNHDLFFCRKKKRKKNLGNSQKKTLPSSHFSTSGIEGMISQVRVKSSRATKPPRFESMKIKCTSTSCVQWNKTVERKCARK